MSAGRRDHAHIPELLFEEFLERCTTEPLCRVQGRVESKTRAAGRLVRFNRLVRVLPHTVSRGLKGPYVRVERMRFAGRLGYVPTGRFMTITWRNFDWVSWTIAGDPNGSWVKIR